MKQYHEFNLAQRILLSIIHKIEKMLYKRNWTYRNQVEWAKRNIHEDTQWLSHDNIARSLCERHYLMLKEEWWTTSHKSQDSFRDGIGLNPHKK